MQKQEGGGEPVVLLSIKELVIFPFIGVSEEERANRQEIKVSIDVLFDNIPIGCQDDRITSVLCYDELCFELASYLEAKPCQLIEHLAYKAHSFLCERYPRYLFSVNVLKVPRMRRKVSNVSFKIGS